MIPAELSVKELATLLNLKRHVVEYRIKKGAIPVRRPSGNPRGKMVIDIETVRHLFPYVYDLLKMADEL